MQFGNMGSTNDLLAFPTTVYVDNDNRVYVVDANVIHEFDSLGNYLGKVFSPLTSKIALDDNSLKPNEGSQLQRNLSLVEIGSQSFGLEIDSKGNFYTVNPFSRPEKFDSQGNYQRRFSEGFENCQ